MSDHPTYFPEAAGEPVWWNGPPEAKDTTTGKGRGEVFVCCDCSWQGAGGGPLGPYEHHRMTGHALRGQSWPVQWDNAQFSDADRSGRRPKRGVA